MNYKFNIQNNNTEFQVVEFSSFEAINQFYQYEIKVITTKELERNEFLGKEAIFSFEDNEIYKVGGIISTLEEIDKIEKFFLYKIKLVPRIYKSNINKDNEVFLNKTIIEIIEILLIQNGLTKDDYQFKLIEKYEKLEYVCQYYESDFNFISRWCEKMGIYFYFEMGEREKMIFVDNKYFVEDFKNPTITYSPISGLEGKNIYKSIQKINLKHNINIKGVKLKDYNPQKASYNLEVESIINNEADKMIYIYGYHFKTKEEGEKIATIIAQANEVYSEFLECISTIPTIFVGYNYILENFYKNSYNKKYFVFKVKKEGTGNTFLNKNSTLKSQFLMIDANKQYRKLPTTPQPKISGVLLAKIDSETKDTPFIDNEGRYKVIMPFDTSSKASGKASHWIRLSQPTGGGNKGFHFPLKKDTEVLISFIDGNPDRPIIIGSLPNSDNPNVVTQNNLEDNVLKSDSGMHITFHDSNKKSHIHISSKDGNSYIKLFN